MRWMSMVFVAPFASLYSILDLARKSKGITYEQFQQYHFNTNWTPMLHYLKELPPKSGYLHLHERTDIFGAKGILGDHLCLFGNPKPSLFRFGTEEEVERQVKAIMDGCAAGAGGGREPVGFPEIRLARCTARW